MREHLRPIRRKQITRCYVYLSNLGRACVHGRWVGLSIVYNGLRASMPSHDTEPYNKGECISHQPYYLRKRTHARTHNYEQTIRYAGGRFRNAADRSSIYLFPINRVIYSENRTRLSNCPAHTNTGTTGTGSRQSRGRGHSAGGHRQRHRSATHPEG